MSKLKLFRKQKEEFTSSDSVMKPEKESTSSDSATKPESNANAKIRDSRILEITEETGWSRDYLNDKIKELNDLKIIHVRLSRYYKYGMHRLNEEELVDLLHTLAERQTISKQLKDAFDKIDRGEISYEDISNDVNQYYALAGKALTPALRERQIQKLQKKIPSVDFGDEQYCTDVLIKAELATLLGFSFAEFIKYQLFRYSLEDMRKIQKDLPLGDVAKFSLKIAEEMHCSYSKASQGMLRAMNNLGISARTYYRDKYYRLSVARQDTRKAKMQRQEAQRKKQIEELCEQTGWSEKELLENIKELRGLGITHVALQRYYKYGMHQLDREQVISLLHALAKREPLVISLQKALQQIDLGELSYDDIEPQVQQFCDLTRQILTPTLRQRRIDAIHPAIPAILEDEDYCTDILVDVELASVLGFSLTSYLMHHLYDYSLPEKRTFVNDKVEHKILVSCTPYSKSMNLINDKYRVSQLLKDFYGRDTALIKSMDDFPVFQSFINKHSQFVFKPVRETMGRGVSLITVDKDTDLQKLLQDLLAGRQTFLMEERIEPHPVMAAFNPDSINTVRLIVFFDGEDTCVALTSFMRTGRPGSFVDNAAQGGVYASVDCQTGILNSDGGDEKGLVYLEHPDSHIHYRGFQLPFWDQALETGFQAAKTIGLRALIGWDLALNSKGRWVIVEGNSLPQFLHQGVLGVGLLPALIDCVGYTPSKGMTNK